jgi:hypothetical protein
MILHLDAEVTELGQSGFGVDVEFLSDVQDPDATHPEALLKTIVRCTQTLVGGSFRLFNPAGGFSDS